MAVLDRRVVGYIRQILKRSELNGEPAWRGDPLFVLRLSNAQRKQLKLSPSVCFRGREAAGIIEAPSVMSAFQSGVNRS